MRFSLHLILLIICFSCSQKNEESKRDDSSGYSVYYRELGTKNSWVVTPSGLVFDKTEVLLLDDAGNGYQFTDTTRSYNINNIAEVRGQQLANCRNALSVKNAGFTKVVKKQLANGENYFVMSGDTNFIFVYRILKDSANYGYTCEMYGSHSNDNSDSRYSFHSKESEVFTFRKYK